MALAFGVYWVILLFMRRELGLSGLLVCVPLGLALLAGCICFYPVGWIYFSIAQVLLDIVLILCFFGGDIRIN